ncbi:hypothetical protein L1049_015352 [Liquidambar formosana]|uniref:Formin-like protein 18 n=1 Tax=Liquidambar formosana TaxID=63359 RepID=A0AAP0WZP4_LIQFO
MDPCPFVRILVGNLALKFPVASKPAFSGVHPSSSPCYCKIKLKNFPTQIATIPLISQDSQHHSQSQSACFNLTHSDISKLAEKRVFSKNPCVKIDIYTGKRGTTCGFNSGKLLGSVSVPLDLDGAESRALVFRNGWVSVGENGNGSATAQLYVNVRAEPDPRFVFEFGGEPECSPQVFQVQGNIKQPVFTCKFSLRSSGDRNLRSRSSLSEPSTSRTWLSSLTTDKDHSSKERKGWSVTIHDLSGSPVALASMVTPFVPSPGSDRVSRSNPGAWLILRPGDGTWKPWGRLQAWLERGSPDNLGYHFELLPNATATTYAATDSITLADSTLSTRKGGKFAIDITNSYNTATPLSTPKSSGDFGSWSASGSGSWSGLLPYCMKEGFVMSSTVKGRGKCSKPEVEVGVEHVTCTEDAAVFVALAAAMDLSMDACRLFSQKLRKELRQQSQDSVV